jgi:hypothetical protein
MAELKTVSLEAHDAYEINKHLREIETYVRWLREDVSDPTTSGNATDISSDANTIIQEANAIIKIMNEGGYPTRWGT